MKIKRIEHVGIVVKDLAESRRLWEEVLGLHLEEIEEMEKSRVRIAIYPVGGSMVELLYGTTPDSKFARLVRERGEGLHHVCFEVENIDAALAELRARGVRLLDEVARSGHQGSRIAFLDPVDTGNVLVELAELPSPSPRDRSPIALPRPG